MNPDRQHNTGTVPYNCRDTDYWDRMKALVRLTGHEVPIRDYYRALHVVNEAEDLKLAEPVLKIAGLLFAALSDAKRYGNDINIRSIYGENTATHSLHLPVLANEMFKRAGLLDAQHSQEIIEEMRMGIARADLFHDLDEWLDEPASLADTLNGISKDRPDQSRHVSELGVKLAAYAMQIDNPDYFFEQRRLLLAVFNAKTGRIASGESLGDLAKRFLPENLSEEWLGHARFILDYNALVERRVPPPGTALKPFCGFAAKAIDCIQGTQHFCRFSEKPPGRKFFDLDGERIPVKPKDPPDGELILPVNLSESNRVLANLDYTLRPIGHLFSCVSNPIELALARAIRDTAVQTIIDCFRIFTPVFALDSRERDPMLNQMLDKISESGVSAEERHNQTLAAYKALKRDLVLRHRLESEAADAQGTSRAFGAFRIESGARTIAALKRALETDWQPKPGEILPFSSRGTNL